MLTPSAAPQVRVSELAPWLSEYEEEFHRLLKWGDHEAIDYPVAGEYLSTARFDHWCGRKCPWHNLESAALIVTFTTLPVPAPPLHPAAIFCIPADLYNPVENIEALHKQLQIPALMKEEVVGTFRAWLQKLLALQFSQHLQV